MVEMHPLVSELNTSIAGLGHLIDKPSSQLLWLL